MAAGLFVNPVAQTTAAGTFGVDTTGYIQGDARDDPSSRNWLSGGVLLPPNVATAFPAGSPSNIVGGMAISEFIPTGYVGGQPVTAGPKAMGSFIMPATAVTGGTLPIAGFSVFNQAHHMVSTPQSPVPQALPGMGVFYYRFGTNARIPLQIDPGLITLQGGLTTQQVSWDFALQRIVAYTTGTALPIRILNVFPLNCMTVTYDAAGNANWNRNGACALVLI